MSFKPTHPDASFSRPPSLPLSLDDTDMASIHATEISQALGQAAPPGSSLPLAEQKAWFLALCRAESVGFGDEAAHERAFTEFQLRLRGFEPLAALPAVSGLADLPASEVFEAHARAGALAEGLTERPPRPKRPAAARSAVFCMPKPEAGGLQAGASRGFSWEAPEPEASRLAHEAETTAKARALLKAAPKTDALAGPVAGLGESIGPGGQIEQEIPAALFDSAPAFLWGEHLERMSARPADEALATEALERGAAWVADRVSSKDIDPAELAAQFRRRASRLDAFVQAREWALAPAAPAQTESMGAESMDSAARRTLAGVPVAVKSLFWVQGEIASAGSKMLSRFRAPEDAGVVAALRAAGADFSCIVKTDEFAMGSRGASCAWGAARHPGVQGASPGGSSSGSAAAVASGMALLGLGSDTGGSVRLPASYCGLWGLKPTRGELSRHGMIAYAFSLDTPGLLARSAKDLSLGFEAMSHGAQFGADSACRGFDRTGLRARVEGFATKRLSDPKPLAGLRVGVPSYCLPGARALALDPAIRARLAAILDQLEKSGAEIGVAQLSDPAMALLSYYLIASTEALSSLARMDPLRLGFEARGSGSWEEAFASGRTELMGHEARLRVLTGAHVLGQSSRESLYAKALGLRREVADRHERAFERFDLILSPTAPGRAPALQGPLDAQAEWAADALTIPASLAGVCSLSAPWGVFEDLHPMGFQLTAPWHAEERLLSWARLMDEIVACPAR